MNKGNFVVVILNGIVVLGLGNFGVFVFKFVMEGKFVFFKWFVDVNLIDIEFDIEDLDEFCCVVCLMGLMFGGINFEDIKVFECFIIE